MSDIPTEVVFEILCALPVKSLLKFRCVSKSWKALIDSRAFVKMHLKTSNTNPNIILSGDSYFCEVSFDLLDTHTPIVAGSSNDESTIVTKSYPFKNQERAVHVKGYCNGLLLVTCGLNCALWNPSTRKFVVLPKFKYEKPFGGSDFFIYQYGLGYDEISDDYKVLRILQVGNDDKNCSRTVVYSLKSRSYRRIKDFPFYIIQVGGGIFVFGALHWILSLTPNMDDEYKIVAFDLGSEEYKWLDLPLCMRTGKFKQIELGVFEGCLSLSCSYESRHIDIWLLRDHKESWSKLFSLEVDGNWSFVQNVILISYSKCGKYAILEKDANQLLCYDIELKSMRKIPINLGPTTFTAVLFSESLELNGIGGGGEVSKKIAQAEEKQKKTKKRDDFLSSGFKLKL